jgi:hypothetical protein
MRILAVIAIVLILPAAGAQELRPGQEYSVPDWARIIIADPDVAKRFVLDSRLNPFCLRGDFDGDGKADFAVLVKERSSGKAGVAVIHRATGRVFIMGAGTEFGNGGDNYSWMDAWIVFDKGRVPQGATREPPPILRGDALLIFKTEAASAILWWNGTRYRWYQQGD